MLMILLSFRGKDLSLVLILQLWFPLEPRFHSERDCDGIFHNFKMKYLQNYKRYKWSMATMFQLILIATQEYYYARKCEVAMLMILWVSEGKNLHLVLILQLRLLLELHLHSESDCHGILHNFKMKYIQNYKRHLQVVNGVLSPFRWLFCLISTCFLGRLSFQPLLVRIFVYKAIPGSIRI